VRQGVKDRGVNHVLAGRVARRQRKGQHVHGTDAAGTPEAVLGLHLTEQRLESDQIVLEAAANRDGVALQQPVRRREQGHLSTHCQRTDPLVVHDEGGALSACPDRCVVAAVSLQAVDAGGQGRPTDGSGQTERELGPCRLFRGLCGFEVPGRVVLGDSYDTRSAEAFIVDAPQPLAPSALALRVVPFGAPLVAGGAER
jgi:hypothetical protein